MLETYLSVAVIKSTRKVDERTKVTLIGKDYTGIGIVKSCQTDGKNFIVTIAIGEPGTSGGTPAGPDPSVLVIDDFITEEQEAQILEDLEDTMRRCFRLPRWPALLRRLLIPSG